MNDGAWFEPKSYGYGAGLPIAWQGWAVLGVYVAAMILNVLLLRRSVVGFVIVLLVATAAVTAVAKAKTRGGWKWREGGAAVAEVRAAPEPRRG